MHKPENGNHAVETGLHTALRGESNGHSILTEREVRNLRAKYATGLHTQEALAAEFGVARSTVCAIIGRELWAHLEIENLSTAQRHEFNRVHALMKSEALSMALKGRAGKKGESHPRAKLSTDSVLLMRAKYKPGIYSCAATALGPSLIH